MKTKWISLSSMIVATSSLAIAVLGNPPPQNNNPPPPAQNNDPAPAHPSSGSNSGKHKATRPHQHHQHNPINPGQMPTNFGDPLGGLSAALITAFQDGRDDFEDTESTESGLGPIFNRDSCAACHSQPSTGGSSNIFVTRFGVLANGVFDPLAAFGGSLLQENAIVPQCMEHIPAQANVVIKRQTTPLYGLGLIEAIADSTIAQGVKKTAVDGVKGRAAMVTDVVSGQVHVGRFGWKAQHSSILGFAADAYMNEMGITNRYFPTENAPNGNQALLQQYDTILDPEDEIDPATGKGDVDKVADYMRLLAPPPTVRFTTNAGSGQGIFLQIGCTNCHTPTLTTAANSIPALNLQKVNLYSDLLLHDMGSLNDKIQQGDASPTEMKTPPLWGLRASAPYLHDGRAATLDAAIRAHDGEAKNSRDRYTKLGKSQQQWLIEFLNSI
jgi:CxxC motif-containing protein (DUF1111 family)